MTDEQIVKKITRYCCELTGVDPASLKEKSRKHPIPYTKQLIAYFISRETRIIYRDIAKRMGWADHTGTHDAIKKITGYISGDTDQLRDVKIIREKLSQLYATA